MFSYEKMCGTEFRDTLLKSKGLYSTVINAFDWSDTPQGAGYWGMVHTQLKFPRKNTLSLEDKQFLLGALRNQDALAVRGSLDCVEF